MSQKGDTPDVLAEKFYKPLSNVAPRVWSRSILHLKKTYNEHKAKPIPALLKSRLTGPSVSWKTFRRLNEALYYADNHTKDCMVFAYEEKTPTSSGQRLFLVTHPQHMWLNHKSRPLEERCTYEVIREGTPCKLYFDLEFSKIYNPGRDGYEMTKIFIKCVIAALLEKFNLKFVTSNFLWLDASTTVKYSCHLILQMGSVAFSNNIQTGYFVSMLLGQVKTRSENNSATNNVWPSSDELKQLYVQNADGGTISFCDDGVYTKNRNFRMFLSTKYGKRAPLVLSEHNQYVSDASANNNETDEIIFYDSLVTYFRKGNSFRKLLVQEKENIPVTICRNSLRPNAGISGNQSNLSPYPEVDNFVLSLVKDDFVSGFIRKWTYLENQDIVTYEIGNYRFCNNINRHHKSNNIMIVVDMKKKQYHQKCYDPMCRAEGYKSVAQFLPEGIISLYSMPDDFFDENCFSQLNSGPVQPSNLKNDKNNCASTSNRIVDELNSNDCCSDLNFDSYPFTQLMNTNKESNVLQKKELVLCNETNFDTQFLKETFSNDTSFDNLNMEDLESEFITSSTMNRDSCKLTVDPAANHSDENSLDNYENSPYTQDISMEDELMMAEAAAAIEATFDDDVSEETIF